MFERAIWLVGALILAGGMVLELPIFRQQAGATEVNIDTAIESSNGEANQNPGPHHVFVSDQVGYVFYVDSTGDCAYSKTTNGGTSWGSEVTFDNQTGDDCLMPVVWFDRWTPGDTTGNYIHVVTKDPGDDGLWYNRLDTNGDTLLSGSTPTDVSISTTTHTMGAAVNTNTYQALTKATDGALYIAIQDDVASGAYAIKCTSSCSSAGNWTLTETYWTTGINQTNPMVLLPLASGDIMAIQHAAAGNDIEYQTYDESGNNWSNESTAWPDISASATAEDEYLQPNIAATVDPLTNDIYLSYIDTETNGLNGGCNDDINVWLYNGSWTALLDPVTDYNPDAGTECGGGGGTGTNEGLVWTRIGFNTNNTEVYVVYIAETTAGTSTTRSIYYKSCIYDESSCDTSGDWSVESSALNSSGADDYDSLAINLSSRDRIYVTWRDNTDDDLRGEVAANITPASYAQSAYRFFANADSTDVGSALATQDTAATVTNVGDAFRLRLLLHVSGEKARVGIDTLKLQYAVKSGTCDTAYSGETYADVTTSTPIAFKNNATPSDGANLTDNVNDPTHSSHAIRNQTYEEANNFTNSNLSIGIGEDGKWDFALYENLAPPSTNFCLRVVYADGSTVSAPTVVPEIATASCTTGVTTDQLMRHGKIFTNGVEEKLCSAN